MEITLNEDQQRAVNNIQEGFNVFLTGPAGTGKSLTIQRIVTEMLNAGKNVYVTASTGIAASLLSSTLNVGVRTFHSWASIGLGKYNASSHAKFIKKNKDNFKRIINTDLLVLDEVSMMDHEFMSKVDDVLQILRKSNQPFGGIQVLFAGDFYQLPPTQKGRKEPFYLFESTLWNSLIEKVVLLPKVYRQSKQEYVDLLTRVRDNQVNDEVIRKMNDLSKNKLKIVDGIRPTTLFCRNMNVDSMNLRELDKLEGKQYVFNSKQYFEDEDVKKENKDSFSLLDQLKLKVGAQVMCLMNLDPDGGIVNGSRGVVTSINQMPNSPDTIENVECVTVKFMNSIERVFTQETQELTNEFGKMVAWKQQLPFKLSWALTIHKSQGATIDLLDIDLSGCFAPGQAYVALSRGTNLNNIRVRNFRRKCIITSQKVIEFHEKIIFSNRKRQKTEL